MCALLLLLFALLFHALALLIRTIGRRSALGFLQPVRGGTPVVLDGFIDVSLRNGVCRFVGRLWFPGSFRARTQTILCRRRPIFARLAILKRPAILGRLSNSG